MNYSSVIITIETITINEFWLPNHIGVCLKRRVLILLPALSVNKGHVLPSAPLIFFLLCLGSSRLAADGIRNDGTSRQRPVERRNTFLQVSQKKART